MYVNRVKLRLMRDAPFYNSQNFQLKDVSQIVAAESLPKRNPPERIWNKNILIAFFVRRFSILEFSAKLNLTAVYKTLRSFRPFPE